MFPLAVLIDLQAVHDNLRTIERDLTNFPPDLAALDSEAKALARKAEETGKALAATQTQSAGLGRDLAAAEKAQELARASVKTATNKVQFTAAIRELDDRERTRNQAARPAKEAAARIQVLEQAAAEIAARRAVVDAQFQELRGIFLSEHENQVAAQALLQARKAELEAQLDPAMRARFDRLILHRQGRAVVPVEGGACSGCRTRLRTPLLAELRQAGSLPCESCTRILFDPNRKA